MKQLFIIAITGLLILGCNTTPERTDYIINGSAKGVYNGIRVYLKSKNERSKAIEIDTAIVFDEKFTFKGNLELPELRYIYINNVNGNLPFMLENSEISIQINASDILKSKIKGSQSNEGYKVFQNGIEALQVKRKSLFTTYRSMVQPKDSIKKKAIKTLINTHNESFLNYPLAFISSHKDNAFSLGLIEMESNKKQFDINAYKLAFESLSTKLKTSTKGLVIGKKLDVLLKKHNKIAHLDIGKIAPNFEAPGPDGKMIALNTIKGKVTIIDFWAAWCGPCRRENPNVVKIYDKYHSKGLEIIGVSLDGTPRQNTPKKDWLDAIKKDKLTWHQVSHLKYFSEPVAQLYNITGIPSTFILDAEGKIVAKNLRGKALELKVKALLED